MTVRKTNQTLILWLLTIAVSFMWGSSYLLVKLSAAEVPPFTLTAARSGIAVVALAIWLMLSQRSIAFSWTQLIHMIVLGTLNGWFPNTLTAVAVLEIDSGLAAVINSASPLVTAPLAYVLITDEYLNWQKVVGILLGFFGIVLLIGPREVVSGGGSVFGQLLMLVVAISDGAGTVYARWIRSANPVQLAYGLHVFTCVPAIIISLITEPHWNFHPTLSVVFSILILGVFCAAVPAVLYLYLIKKFQATNVSTVSYLMPVWAVILGVSVLHESPTIHSIIGSAVVLVGVWIVNSVHVST